MQTRRQFLNRAAILAGGLLTAACQPKVIEKVVKETVFVEKEVEKEVTKVVEKEVQVEKEVTRVVEKVATAVTQPKEIMFFARTFTPSKYIGRELGVNEAERVAFDEIATAYTQDHPDVKIVFVPQPGQDIRQTIVTMMVAGTAPDMTWTQPNEAVEDLGKGWWLAIDPYLELPNPYIKGDQPGAKMWHDLFYPSVDFWTAPDDHLYTLLGDQTQVGYYANKNVFQEAGVESIRPKNWEEFMRNCEAVKTKLEMPVFAIAGNGVARTHQLTWTGGWLSKYLFWPYIPGYDTSNNGWADAWEIAEAIKEGTFSASMPENVERLRILKRQASYWQEGALGADWEGAHRLFQTGQVAIIQQTIGMLSRYQGDPDRKFDMDWFYFPPLDKETSSLVPDGVPMTSVASGYGPFNYAITQTARWQNTASECADFLAYTTVPEHLSQLVNEVLGSVPNVKGATVHPDLAPFAITETISYPPSTFQEDDSILDLEYGFNFSDMVLPYCIGEASEQQMLSDLQRYMEEAADRVIAKRALTGK
jgi:ABC-type glycerol-3-phosphate transport system substrate-binding protein